MNDRKLQQLFRSAGRKPAPETPEGFDAGVMRAVRREAWPGGISILDQLAGLFPRLAVGAALVIGLCVAVDVGLSKFAQPDISTGILEASEQWLFAVR